MRAKRIKLIQLTQTRDALQAELDRRRRRPDYTVLTPALGAFEIPVDQLLGSARRALAPSPLEPLPARSNPRRRDPAEAAARRRRKPGMLIDRTPGARAFQPSDLAPRTRVGAYASPYQIALADLPKNKRPVPIDERRQFIPPAGGGRPPLEPKAKRTLFGAVKRKLTPKKAAGRS